MLQFHSPGAHAGAGERGHGAYKGVSFAAWTLLIIKAPIVPSFAGLLVGFATRSLLIIMAQIVRSIQAGTLAGIAAWNLLITMVPIAPNTLAGSLADYLAGSG